VQDDPQLDRPTDWLTINGCRESLVFILLRRLASVFGVPPPADSSAPSVTLTGRARAKACVTVLGHHDRLGASVRRTVEHFKRQIRAAKSADGR